MNRHIKLLICVTIYNEDQDTLRKTLMGICEVHRPAASQTLLPRCRSGPCASPHPSLA
jgi:hypothetical protein